MRPPSSTPPPAGAGHELTEAIFAGLLNAHSYRQGHRLALGHAWWMRRIIDARRSTRTSPRGVDPESLRRRRATTFWLFLVMKAHIGVDADSGVTHSP